jgi:LysM repeat protein
MSRKSRVLLSVVIAVLLASAGTPGIALAWSGCGSSYVVQWGDTLGGIAMLCGTSVAALRQANPNLGYYIYAGQTLWMPGGNPGYAPGSSYGTAYAPSYGQTYVVGWGDTLRKIGARLGITVTDLIAANPQLWNPNLIYPGQVINLPGSGTYQSSGHSYNPPSSYATYTVRRGDTLRIIASCYGMSVDQLWALNPQIWNPNWIYAGQVIRIR